MKIINYKSDFDFILRLRDCKEPEKTVPFPECDFDARFWTANKANAYTASCKGGVYTNCFRTEDGGMHFVFDNHRMGVGVLQWEPHFELPNSLYPDSIQDRFSKEPLDIELVTGAGDCPTTSEVENIAPFIKGDKGERGDRGEKGEKGDGFTAAQIAKLDELPEAEALSARIDAAASASFIDLWNAACGTYGRFNPETGFFELNGITDLTKEQAIEVYNASVSVLNNTLNTRNGFTRMESIRSILPLFYLADLGDWYQTFYVCRSLEVVAILGKPGVNKAARMFTWCDRLKRVIGELYFSSCNDSRDAFTACKALESIKIRDINCSLSFQDSPLLDYDSLKFMIDTRQAHRTNPITVTVHPTVYAKLTDGTDEQWGALPAAAAAKHISFATV